VEVRREEILVATVRELQRIGFAGTRIADVAGALDVSAGLIHYHFASKERLLAEAFAFAAERDLDRLAQARTLPGGATERLAAVLWLYAPSNEASQAWALWIDASSAALRWPELTAVSRTLTVRWQTAFEELIREGVTSGEFRCSDPHAAAWRINALLDGLSEVATLHPDVVDAERLRAWVRGLVGRELGLDPDDPRLIPATTPDEWGR
jgi:AcrR family transcriptional regulator